MPPAPLVWKCGCEAAKWRGVSEKLRKPSGEVAMCIGESAAQGAPGGAQESPEAPGRLRSSSEAPRELRMLKNSGRPPWGPGGSPRRLQRGVLSFRTLEFWRPDLGDLEAQNLDSLDDDSLVAKAVASTAWWPHKGAGGFLNFKKKETNNKSENATHTKDWTDQNTRKP